MRAGEYIELCGPTGCARTNDGVGLAQFKAFVAPITKSSQIPGFPPAVQGYYRIRSTYLRKPAVYTVTGGNLGIELDRGIHSWMSLGPFTVTALNRLKAKVRPFRAPLPSRVLVNNKRVKVKAVYRHVLDPFPEAMAVKPSTKPWIGVAVTFAKNVPWPDVSVTLRKGTRIMLRPDHAVTVSKALAAQIAADARMR